MPSQTKTELATRIVALEDLILSSHRPVEWLIEDRIPQGEAVLVSGQSQAGKTYLILDMAMSVAYGQPWLGVHEVPEARPVIYAPSEGRQSIGRRVRSIIEHKYPYTRPLPPFHFWGERLDLTQGHSLTFLIEDAERTEAGLVIVDVLRDATPGVDENSAAMGDMFGKLRDAAFDLDTTFIVAHHLGKDASKGGRGHSSMRDKTDIEIIVKGTPNVIGDHIIETKVSLDTVPPIGKNRNQEPWREVIYLRKPEGLETPVVVTGSGPGVMASISNEVALEVARYLHDSDANSNNSNDLQREDGWSYADIAEAIDRTTEAVRKGANTLADLGVLSINKSGRAHSVRLTEKGREAISNDLQRSNEGTRKTSNNAATPYGGGALEMPTVVEELVAEAKAKYQAMPTLEDLLNAEIIDPRDSEDDAA